MFVMMAVLVLGVGCWSADTREISLNGGKHHALYTHFLPPRMMMRLDRGGIRSKPLDLR